MKRKGSRHYDEREVTTILERAAELQGAALVPSTGGRSLEEIKSIAVEAGMDVAAIDAAAATLVEPEDDRWPLVGSSPYLELHSTVMGVPDDDDRQQLVAMLQRVVDAKGRAQMGPQGLEWRRFGILGREMVVVTSRKGRTRIEARGRYRRGMAASFLGGGLAGGLAAAGLLELAGVAQDLGDWVAPVVFGAAFFTGRTVWGWFARIKQRKLRRMAERSVELIEEAPEPKRLLPPRGADD